MPLVHKSGILARLQRRFGLDVSSTSRMDVAYSVVPTTDADSLLKRIEGETGGFTAIGGATAWHTGLIVPVDERWTIKTLNFYRSSGDNFIDQVALLSIVTGAYCLIDVFTAVSSYANILGTDIALSAGDEIVFHTSGAGSSSSPFVTNAWTEIESIY